MPQALRLWFDSASGLAHRRSGQALRLLISSGPTREPIDAVRFLSNYSTGLMGTRLAYEALRRGHRVTLVSGPTELEPPPKAKTVHVESARQMHQALRRQMPRADVLIMAAAVSDFRPIRTVSEKLARRGRLSLTLEATPDIVANLPRRRNQLVVGFAVEVSRIRERTARKLREKRLDLIVGQRLSATTHGGSASGGNGTGSPFGHRAVQAFLLRSSGTARELGKVSKSILARVLLDEIEQLWYGQKRHQTRRSHGTTALAAGSRR